MKTNKAFTNNQELILDDNFKIVPDSDYGVVLVFLTEKENKKKELVPFEQKYHYPRIAQALRKYCDLCLNNQERFGLLISKLDELHLKIDKIDNEFKQF